MFWASFKVGMTTLIDARTGAAAGLDNEIEGWMEIDKCLTTSWCVDYFGLWNAPLWGPVTPEHIVDQAG
jgi:hypothetical protein